MHFTVKKLTATLSKIFRKLSTRTVQWFFFYKLQLLKSNRMSWCFDMKLCMDTGSIQTVVIPYFLFFLNTVELPSFSKSPLKSYVAEIKLSAAGTKFSFTFYIYIRSFARYLWVSPEKLWIKQNILVNFTLYFKVSLTFIWNFFHISENYRNAIALS